MYVQVSKCHMAGCLWHLGVECLVTNQSGFDFSVFPYNLLGSQFGRHLFK
jgi:hypothetical protein